MRDRRSFIRDNQGHVVAWAIALAFLGLIAAPTLWSKHPAERGPGLVDVGTPGVNVTAVPPGQAVGKDDIPLSEWAYHSIHERNRLSHDHDNDAASAAPPGGPARPAM